MKSPIEIKTGAEMYYVDLAITRFLNTLKDEVEDNNSRNLLWAYLIRTKAELERCMVHEWNMSLGEELKLDETD